MSALIEVSNAWKTFTRHRRRGLFRVERTRLHAVAGLSFSVDRGEMVGYLGPNGAGKSTTIKLLTGIIAPTSGRIRVRDLEPFRNRVRLAYHSGTMFGQRSQLWWDLPVRDSFEILGLLYRVPRRGFNERMRFLIESLELGPLLESPVRQLSLGQRVRCELAAALVHRPDILYLDEPTIGLDVTAKYNVRTVLQLLNRTEGLTVMVTSHDLGDIERLSSRLMIIDHGEIISDGTLEDLIRRYQPYRHLVVDLEEARPPLVIDGADTERVAGARQWLRFRRDTTTAANLVAKIAAQAPISDISLEEPGIEELVQTLYAASSGGRPRQPQGPAP